MDHIISYENVILSSKHLVTSLTQMKQMHEQTSKKHKAQSALMLAAMKSEPTVNTRISTYWAPLGTHLAVQSEYLDLTMPTPLHGALLS